MLLLASCGKSDKLTIRVENTTAVERVCESVELSWSDIEGKLQGVNAENVVVLDGSEQLPSQVLYSATDSLQAVALLFQPSVGAKSSKSYSIVTGERESYTPQVYSRYVPERKGDYAWENNVVAYRAYGKPLEVELKTQGVDVWVKRTSDLIINKWYAAGHYHSDSGEGMDCYSVGRTLGGGSSAPVVDSKIVLSCNFIEWQRVSNGALRTEFILKYAPYDVAGESVTMTKRFSLDANSRFTKVVDTYSGAFDTLNVGVGCMVHTPKDPQREAADYFAIYERASDDKKGVGGSIGVSVITPSIEGNVETVSRHKLRLASLKSGDELSYYIGSGWSKGGVPDAKSWFEITEQEAFIRANPLQVSIK